ncbi:MAG: HIT family protein, partial [Candidatus Acidiferrales bacterium]
LSSQGVALGTEGTVGQWNEMMRWLHHVCGIMGCRSGERRQRRNDEWPVFVVPEGVGMSCVFCEIVARKKEAAVVYEDADSLAFLDHRPVFHGHVLLATREHIETLADLPGPLIQPFFANAQMLARAVEKAMGAEGSFMAINNRVSQSVPHLHIHIVPRRKGDGLRGFFWPRTKYENNEALRTVQAAIQAAVKEFAKK